MRKLLIFKVIVFLIFISCKKELKKDSEFQKDATNKNTIEGTEEDKEQNILEYSIFFYDTVYVNKSYKGYIYFKNVFDTLNTKQGDQRFTLYYSKITDRLITDYPTFKKQKLDTFGARNNHEIPIKFKFDKLGVNYVDGFLEDEIYIPIKNDSTKVRVVTQDARITFKVFVKDSIQKSLPEKEPYEVKKIKPGYL